MLGGPGDELGGRHDEEVLPRLAVDHGGVMDHHVGLGMVQPVEKRVADDVLGQADTALCVVRSDPAPVVWTENSATYRLFLPVNLRATSDVPGE